MHFPRLPADLQTVPRAGGAAPHLQRPDRIPPPESRLTGQVQSTTLLEEFTDSDMVADLLGSPKQICAALIQAKKNSSKIQDMAFVSIRAVVGVSARAQAKLIALRTNLLKQKFYMVPEDSSKL